MLILQKIDSLMYRKLADLKKEIKSRRNVKKDSKLSRIALKEYRVLWRSKKIDNTRRCYFSSFDRDGVVDEYVFHYLLQLKSAGFDTVFITTSASISDQDISRLQSVTIGVIQRSNFGLDFFSWKLGIKEFGLNDNRIIRVLFANDSVLGPIFNLGGYIEKMDSTDYDMVGFTASWDVAFHVQSYFLYCKQNIIVSKLLEKFFSDIMVVSSKSELIRRYEVGFTQVLTRAGFLVGALVDHNDIARYSRDTSDIELRPKLSCGYDPSLLYWNRILLDRRTPFLKKKLVTLVGQNNGRMLVALAEIFDADDSIVQFEMLLNYWKRVSC